MRKKESQRKEGRMKKLRTPKDKKGKEEKMKTKVPLVEKESTWISKNMSLSNIFKKQTGGIKLKV